MQRERKKTMFRFSTFKLGLSVDPHVNSMESHVVDYGEKAFGEPTEVVLKDAGCKAYALVVDWKE